jgi:hypothetical protein
LCRARLVATGEDGGNWADKTVRRYLADKGLALGLTLNNGEISGVFWDDIGREIPFLGVWENARLGELL